MTTKLEVYEFHDDPTELDEDELRWWVLVAATSSDTALEIAVSHYGGQAPAEVVWNELLSQSANKLDVKTWPADLQPQRPGVLRDLRQQRLAGWRDNADGESSRCDHCEYASMGLEEFRVCDECHICLDCGCECEAMV